jgi:hypothetical protein
LDDSNLEIEVVVLSGFFLPADLRDIFEVSDVPFRKYRLFIEALGDPISDALDHLLLGDFKGEGLTEVGERLKLAWVSGALH